MKYLLRRRSESVRLVVEVAPIRFTNYSKKMFTFNTLVSNSPFPSLYCCYKMNTTTTMQRESS